MAIDMAFVASSMGRGYTVLDNQELALAMAEVSRVLASEPEYASRSYLIQRISRYMKPGHATCCMNQLIKRKAVKSVPGSRRGFPMVYVKSEAWNFVWVECTAKTMSYETLKEMNKL